MKKIMSALSATVFLLLGAVSATAWAQEPQPPFLILDDIGDIAELSSARVSLAVRVDYICDLGEYGDGGDGNFEVFTDLFVEVRQAGGQVNTGFSFGINNLNCNGEPQTADVRVVPDFNAKPFHPGKAEAIATTSLIIFDPFTFEPIFDTQVVKFKVITIRREKT